MQPPLADLWLVLGPAIGLLAGGIALATALISRRTAVEEREARCAEREAAEQADGPGVLLPTRLRCFIDRTEAMGEAMARIGGGDRVLAIAGGAGVGKSAVAGELAHRLRADGAGDGVPDLSAHDFLWIDGRDGCPTLVDVCRQVTLLTGDQSLSAVADDAKLEALRAHLARNKTVLLLDNIKLGTEGSGEPLRELLRTIPSGSLAIASLNSPYAIDGSRVLLEDLEPAYVQELIEHEARRLGLEGGLFDVEFVARLQRAVGGNPRLIESFLRALSRSSRSLEELLDAIEKGEGLSELFLPVWDELSEPAHAVLGAIACLRGQALAEQLAVGCALTASEISTAIEELIEAGCLKTVRITGEPILYTCTRALCQYAIVTTSKETVGLIASRLAGYFVEFLRAEPENAHAAIPHVAGIRAVLDELSMRERDDDLQTLFRASLDILYTLGLFDDRLLAGRLAYDSAEQAGNDRAASLASEVLASTHALRGELDRAEEALALGRLAAERSRDPSEDARQRVCAGVVHYRRSDPHGALRAIEGAEALARDAGNLETAVNALVVEIAAHWYEGEIDASARAAEQCLQLCEEMDWKRPIAYPLRYLAEAAIQRGEVERARDQLEQAREIASAYDDKRGIARISLSQARLELAAGHLRNAGRAARRTVSEAGVLGLPPETREAKALEKTIRRAVLFPPLRWRYRRRLPHRLTDAPVGGG